MKVTCLLLVLALVQCTKAKSLDNSDLGALRVEEGPPQYEHKERAMDKREEDATLHNYFHCHTTAGNVEVKTKTESIYAHGKIRDRHYGVGVNPLSWNRSLASAAKAHAEVMAGQRSMFHSAEANNGQHGENVAYAAISMSASENETIISGPALMTYDWYAEIENFNFNTHNAIDPSKDIGHFTAMVWKGVTSFGCGLATSPKIDKWHKTYYCCKYSPSPNVAGAYAENVPAPISGDTNAIPPEDLNVTGCCDYTAMCYKYKRYCSQYAFLQDYCAITCKPECTPATK